MEILKNPNYDFLGKTRILLTISAILILGGSAYIAKNGVRYGVEFSEGTQLIVKFASTPQVDKVRSVVDKVAPGATIQTYDQVTKNQLLIRVAGHGEEHNLEAAANAVLGALGTDYADNKVQESSVEIVGPTVGGELRKKALQLTVFGLVAQLIYIGWRFQGAVWGGAAVLAVFHDVIITFGLLQVFGFEVTLNVIAGLLTLVGYSVNDTIVVFDRVRENLKQRRKDPLPRIINDSINQTLSRTLIASGTTFLTVLGLLVFGGEVLRGFAFTMVVGIVVGTYSSIYIASPIVVWWSEIAQRRAAGKPPAKAA